jgi:hypothetical protein
MGAFLDRYPLARNLASLTLGLGGLACLAFLVVYLVQDVSFWLLGRKVAAEVVEVWAEPVGQLESGELDFRYFLRYRFTTADGREFGNTSRVSVGEWIGVGHGQQSQARADPLDGQAVPAAAPVPQPQRHIPQFTAGGLEVGNPVAVVYLPMYPAHNRLDDSRFIPAMACAYVPLLLLGSGGLVVGWRSLRPALAGTLDAWRT